MPHLHIMIVDDDPSFAELVRKIARRCGFETFVVHSAAEFDATYGRARPDLILLDLHMPGVDGVEILRKLATLGCDASVLLVSGFDTKIIDTARRLGAARGLKMERGLTKPIRAADLRTVLDEFKAKVIRR